MNRPADVLMQLIRCSVFGSDMILEPISDSVLSEVYTLAKQHSLTGLVGYALEKQGLLEGHSTTQLFQNAMLSEIYYYEKMHFVYQTVCEAFENAQVVFMPLKGAVLRQYYPQPWLRTSCDIDVLVHKCDLALAARVLTSQLGFEKIGETTHDVSYSSKDGIRIELHFDLIERDCANLSYRVLKQIWEHASPVQGKYYQYELDSAMFYFYHIAHMAKHFGHAGCGVRMFLDTAVMKNHLKVDSVLCRSLLKRADLLTFHEAVQQICDIWFFEEEYDDISRRIEAYTLECGTFGFRENMYITGRRRHGGTVGYLLSRVFLPFRILRDVYPVLNKWPILAPICVVHRWLQILFGRKRIRLQEYFRIMKHGDAAKAETIADIMDAVGL